MVAPPETSRGDTGLDFNPHRLWSLLEMLKVSARHFMELGEVISDISINLYIMETQSRDVPSDGLKPDEIEHMRRHLIKIWDVCKELGLPIAGDLISARVDQSSGKANLPESQREFDLLIDAVKAEILNKLFLFVPAHLAKYYERDDLLSDQARAAFPSSTVEMRSAGNCLTAGLNTACVFHCMRAIEHGLRALANNVEVNFDVQQWKNVIDQIESTIRTLGNSMPAGTTKTERLQFLSEASAGFSHFKDGWRNHVMHTRASYDEPQATVVIEHVRIFLEALSKNLKEVV